MWLLYLSWQCVTHLQAAGNIAAGDATSLRRANVREPANATVYRSLAELAVGDEAEALLVEAHRRSQFDARILVHLGLLRERLGRDHEAEADLLQATRISSLFLPRWTL